MGNVLSAVLMYALQAAWMCQRLIDQDYRQNHGSRLKPIMDDRYETEVDIFFPKSSSTPILSKSPHHKSRPAKTSKPRRELFGSESENETKRRKRRKPGRMISNLEDTKSLSEFNFSRLDNSDAVTNTTEYVNKIRHGVGHRRAFSDVNVKSNYSLIDDKMEERFLDDNQNYLGDDNDNENETMISRTDQAILRLVVSRGCMTKKAKDYSPYSVI